MFPFRKYDCRINQIAFIQNANPGDLQSGSNREPSVVDFGIGNSYHVNQRAISGTRAISNKPAIIAG